MRTTIRFIKNLGLVAGTLLGGVAALVLVATLVGLYFIGLNTLFGERIATSVTIFTVVIVLGAVGKTVLEGGVD